MNKKLLTVAVGAALAASTAIAQADVKVYGVAHLSADSIDREVSGDTGQWFLSNNSSRFGIKATEDLGGGLTGVAQFEIFVNMDNTVATATSNLDVTANRDNYVGLESKMVGSLYLGRRDTAQKDVGGIADLFFREQLGEARAITNQSNSDGRNNNSITYVTPKLGPVTAKLQYTVEDTFASEENELNANVRADVGPANLGGAYWKTTRIGEDTTGYRVAAKVKVGPANVAALYQKVSAAGGTIGADRATWGVGASFTFLEKNTIKAQFYSADATDNTTSTTEDGGKQVSVGFDHAFSKTTVGYIAYAKTTNDVAGNFEIGGNGHGVTSATASPDLTVGNDISGFSLGVRMSF